jgi:autotransporter-associated beta strand protein
MVSRQLIATSKGYQLGLLKTAALDGAGEFIAYKPSSPASSARRVPADILALSISVGPRQVTIRDNTLKNTSLNLNITSRDYATLSVLDYEGVSILTQRYSNSPKSKPPLNRVILLSARGDFQGVNAPEITIPEQTGDGVGIVTLELTDSKIVDLAPYGNVAPPNPTNNATSGSVSLNSSPDVPLVLTPITSGATTTTGSGTLTLNGNNTYSGGTVVNSGNLTVGGGTTLGGNGTLSLNSGTLSGTPSVISGGPSTLTIDARNGNRPFGLEVDADGKITQLPTLPTTASGNLVIITSTGTHTYTRDVNNVWTPVAP